MDIGFKIAEGEYIFENSMHALLFISAPSISLLRFYVAVVEMLIIEPLNWTMVYRCTD